MDILDEELLRFWRCLNSNNVRYIMIGGFATSFHGFNRSTEDIDLWIEDTVVNRENLRAALKAFGYGDIPTLATMEFVPGWTSFHLAKGIELDILTAMKGLEQFTFSECLEVASVAELDGIAIPFLHINQLIQNKKAVNRPKDKIDVLELERIRSLNEGK